MKCGVECIIVQRSASERAYLSPCIWYSKSMESSVKIRTLVQYGLAELCMAQLVELSIQIPSLI